MWLRCSAAFMFSLPSTSLHMSTNSVIVNWSGVFSFLLGILVETFAGVFWLHLAVGLLVLGGPSWFAEVLDFCGLQDSFLRCPYGNWQFQFSCIGGLHRT